MSTESTGLIGKYTLLYTAICIFKCLSYDLLDVDGATMNQNQALDIYHTEEDAGKGGGVGRGQSGRGRKRRRWDLKPIYWVEHQKWARFKSLQNLNFNKSIIILCHLRQFCVQLQNLSNPYLDQRRTGKKTVPENAAKNKVKQTKII